MNGSTGMLAAETYVIQGTGPRLFVGALFVAMMAVLALSIRKSFITRTPPTVRIGGRVWPTPVDPAEISRGLAALAGEQGWTYAATGAPAPFPFYLAAQAADPTLGLLGPSVRPIRDLVVGRRRGREVRLFRYDLPDNDAGLITTRTVVVVVPTPVQLPGMRVLLRTGDGVAGVDAAVGETHLESDDFNRRFALMASDTRFAYNALPPLTIEKLLASPHGFNVADHCLLGMVSLFEPAAVLACVDTLLDVVEGIPGFVWDELEREPAPPLSRWWA